MRLGSGSRAFNRVRRGAHLRLRRAILGGYYRLVGLNYDRQWIAPRKRTVGGTVRSYELYNRHGRDAMLAAVDARAASDGVVYDVGANVGVYALALAAETPDRRIVAFEPAPRVVEQLRANVEVNGFADRIDVRHCGLGEVAGERPFYVSTYAELSGFDAASARRWEASVAAETTVPVRRLDDVVDEGPTPEVLKIDVEGAAPSVLRGGRETLERHRPTVFLEVHGDGLDGDEGLDCRSILDDAGYRVRSFDAYWVAEPTEGDRSEDGD
ncbi:FkbM family methyltransferase [Halovivax gelatinilyticus]|uniref:FkbM family methyltransferase n=1 Tax=Halovivax gelatinilyticus TaxID=2961597 RepID=UPI0020CA795E|nr:FkbM family methyltransferase [Halovivax gelatinilyticus]